MIGAGEEKLPGSNPCQDDPGALGDRAYRFSDRGAEDVGRCVRPSIRPSAVLLRPPTREALTQLLAEFTRKVRKLRQETRKRFFFSKRGAANTVAVHNISFLNPRGKRSP